VNHRTGEAGERYKAVEGKQAAVYETLADDIHLNPMRVGLITRNGAEK
jgi:hypothetical protein